MATREELIAALRRADAAGDVAAARAIAARIAANQQSQQAQQAPAQQDRGILGSAFDMATKYVAEPIAGIIEPATQLASSMVAEPIAGVSGLASIPFVGKENAGDVVKSTREALTYRPRSQSGQAVSGAAGAVAAPIGRALVGAQEWLGDQAYEKTESPTLAALAEAVPTAVIEALGIKAGPLARQAKQAGSAAKLQSRALSTLDDAAPTIEQLKTASSAIYKEIDDAGVTIKPDALKSLTSSIDDLLRKESAIKEVTPKSFGVLKAFQDRVKSGASVTLTELENLRRMAKGAAAPTEAAEVRLTGLIADKIDDFMDAGGVQTMNLPKDMKVGAKYKAARDLYARAMKSEEITNAIDVASRRSSNFNSALKNEFNKILNSKAKAKYFTPGELKMIRDVVDQPAKQNLAEFVGKFGFEVNTGPSQNFLGGSIGTAAGATAGGMLAGPAGAAAGGTLLPAAGTISRNIAKNMRLSRAEFADKMIRAGRDGQKIAEAYMTAVDKSARSVDDLTSLLLNPRVDLSLIKSENAMVRQAAEAAANKRAQLAGAIAAGANKEQQ